MNGAETVIQFLLDKGVDTAFGYPGGPVLVLYEAIYKLNFPHILSRHEQGAIHAAQGYARVSGRTGVVFATSGPGATNLVTGLADAYLDSTPILAITGAVARKDIGRDAFQEADITGITDPITKYSYLVMEPNQLLPILEEAWNMTRSGRPGPVLVNIPKDIMSAIIDETESNAKQYVPLRPKRLKSENGAIDILNLIAAAERPVLLAGGGNIISADAPAGMRRFIERLKLPLIQTMMAKGCIEDEHPLNQGMAGMHGSLQANKALSDCDLLIAVGCRFSDRLIANPERYAHKPGRKIVHVDIDPAEIGKNVPPTLEIEEDAGKFYSEMLAIIEQHPELAVSGIERCGAWLDKLSSLRQRYEQKMAETAIPAKPLLPQYVLRRCSELCRGLNPIVVTDVGQHQMFACQHFEVQSPRSFITSGGLGTMGFGLPAAIGASAADPSRPTVAILGDGGAQMTIQELGLLEALDLPLVILIMDNGTLGMVRQWQELFFDGHYSQSMLNNNPDFVKLAQAYGIRACRVCDAAELESAFTEALSSRKPRLLHVDIRQQENVYPMIPAGKDAEDIIMPGITDAGAGNS